jgi:uncharacterized protein (DUF2236 family)
MADAGLFGPDSVTWRIHADPLTGIAGLRALLLRALHPVAAAAASERSRYSGHGADTWGRLRQTTDDLGVITYGSSAQALVTGARLRAVDAMVSGAATGTDQTYRGDDEALLLWGHCCLLDSFLDVVRRGGLTVTDADADRYVAEQVRAAALVGLEPDVVPATTAAVAEHLERTRADLAVTPAARAVAAEVATSPTPERPPVPPWAGVAGLAFAALPPWARRMYALSDLSGAAALSDAATTVALRALRTALSGVPGRNPAARTGARASSAWAGVTDHGEGR